METLPATISRPPELTEVEFTEGLPLALVSVLERRYLSTFNAEDWIVSTDSGDVARPLLRDVIALGRPPAATSGWSEAMLQAIDYKTGKIRWSHKWDGSGSIRSGVLSTAGNLVFAGDASANFVALNATTGEPVWHSRLHASITNGPITFEMDGMQYVVVGAGDSLYAFVLRAR